MNKPNENQYNQECNGCLSELFVLLLLNKFMYFNIPTMRHAHHGETPNTPVVQDY